MSAFRWPTKIPYKYHLAELLGQPDDDSMTLPSGTAALRKLLGGLTKIGASGANDLQSYFIDVDGSRVGVRKNICPCITRTRGSAGGFWMPAHWRRMGVTTMAKFQGIPLDKLDMRRVSSRQQGQMIGNAWSLNVSTRVMRELLLCMNFATSEEMRDPWSP